MRSQVVMGALVGLSMLFGVSEAAAKKKKAAGAEPAKAEAVSASAEFDRQAASSAIGEVSLQKCKATNATKGDGHVVITFATSGAVEKAEIDKGPWVGSPVAKCMVKAFKKAKVPAFRG